MTLVRRGSIDHSDSLGATARFGPGDVQWMTAGKGIVHAEMFPLRDREGPNPLELFQIWLNLPKADKMVEPYFTMLWGPTIPEHTVRDGTGRATRVVTVAGPLGNGEVPTPPPNSWSARPEADIAIWTIRMEPGATWTVPPTRSGSGRTLYFFRGGHLRVGDHEQASHAGLVVRGDVPLAVENGEVESELLLLQGRPIGDPVVHYGPFVMNARHEIEQAMMDFRRIGFGGWPWERDDPVHTREQGRFAIHADGRREEPVED
jgi:redox-sensitive bicupin YhaK (pirin superfamily)